VLRPDGFLFLGGAETLIGMETGYERLTGIGCSYYRPMPRAASPAGAASRSRR
jgi:chemotaxis protein methyltransferase CheR